MKKILAVSLCAIMAISAARADIASVEYVEKQTGVLTNLTTTAKGNLVGAINEVAGKANAAATQTAFNELKSTVDGLTTGDNSVGGQIDDKISELNKADTAVAKQFVTAVSEESGIVSVSRRALEAADIPTIEQSQVNGLTTALSGKQATISDLATIRSGAAAGATALQKADIVTGTGNGTISVDGADVAVKGLGSAAYTASGAYATSAQGAKADTALQKADIVTGTGNGTISVDGADVAVKGLGSAAYTASTAYATSAQGTKADAALPRATFDGMLSTSENGENGKIPTVGFMMDSIGDAQSEIGGSISAINTALSGKQATLTGTNVTSDGNGNVVTAVTAADGKVTVTKGTTLGSLATKSTVTSADITDGTIAKADLATAVQTSLDKADAALPKSEFTSFQTTNTANIADAKKAGTDAAQDVVDLQATLTALATFPVACQNSETNCALLLKGGKLTWEKVTY